MFANHIAHLLFYVRKNNSLQQTKDKKMDGLQFHERLKIFREHRRLSTKNIAEVLFISTKEYEKYESGEKEFPLKDLPYLYYVGCNLNWLSTGEGEIEN